MKSRKMEVLNNLEVSLLIHVENYLANARDSTPKSPQMGLLRFCYLYSFNFHAIVILEGLILNQEFKTIYKTWYQFQGKRFYEKQNAEAYFISKCLKNSKLFKIIQ